jgi:heat shock protein HtpX
VCPQCGVILPVDAGYRAWCDRCGWNLSVPEQHEKPSLPQRMMAAINMKYSRRLYDQLLRHPPRRQGMALPRLLAYLIAALVHLATLSLVALGLWLCFFAFPTARLLGILLGMACLVLVSLLFLPQERRVTFVPILKEEAPALYRTADRIAHLLGGRPVKVIHYDAHYHARTAGWRHRHTLAVGLPLLAVLDAQELAALLSHELAHAANHDPSRSLFILAAQNSLGTWFSLFYSRNRWQIRRGLANLVLLIVNIVGLPAACLLWLTGVLLNHLLWVEQQRAEYLADWLAAQVSGTAAQLALLDKGLLGGVYDRLLLFAFLDHSIGRIIEELKGRIQAMPARELERIRREEELVWTAAPSGHPPAAYRKGVLAAHPAMPGELALSPAEFDRIRFELGPLVKEMQRWTAGLDEITFREFFNLQW